MLFTWYTSSAHVLLYTYQLDVDSYINIQSSRVLNKLTFNIIFETDRVRFNERKTQCWIKPRQSPPLVSMTNIKTLTVKYK